jgi:hypothetical protein
LFGAEVEGAVGVSASVEANFSVTGCVDPFWVGIVVSGVGVWALAEAEVDVLVFGGVSPWLAGVILPAELSLGVEVAEVELSAAVVEKPVELIGSAVLDCVAEVCRENNIPASIIVTGEYFRAIIINPCIENIICY